jgi:hypothetical protein
VTPDASETVSLQLQCNRRCVPGAGPTLHGSGAVSDAALRR